MAESFKIDGETWKVLGRIAAIYSITPEQALKKAITTERYIQEVELKGGKIWILKNIGGRPVEVSFNNSK